MKIYILCVSLRELRLVTFVATILAVQCRYLKVFRILRLNTQWAFLYAAN